MARMQTGQSALSKAALPACYEILVAGRFNADLTPTESIIEQQQHPRPP
jgi:hypothetical protein